MRYRWIGMGAVVLVSAGIWYIRAAEKSGVAKPKAGDSAAALVKRGEYLVNEVAHCSHCHTPQGKKGQLDRSRLLQGATLPIRPREKTEHWAGKSPDITRSGLAGMWSEEDMIKFLRTGTNPEGEKPTPPMPVFHLHQEDARAVALYLKSLPGKKGQKRKEGGKGTDETNSPAYRADP